LGIKGSALINTSRIRAEIAKLRNFETGFAGYFLRHNALPPNDNISLVSFSCFKTENLLARKVVITEDVPAAFAEGGGSWSFCTNIATDVTTGRFVPGVTVTVENAGVIAGNTGKLNRELICNIEGILDDGNLYQGAGRTLSSGVPSFLDNCEDPANKSNYTEYVYLAFSPNSQIPSITPAP
jgi:hypothetical protein